MFNTFEMGSEVSVSHEVSVDASVLENNNTKVFDGKSYMVRANTATAEIKTFKLSDFSHEDESSSVNLNLKTFTGSDVILSSNTHIKTYSINCEEEQEEQLYNSRHGKRNERSVFELQSDGHHDRRGSNVGLHHSGSKSTITRSGSNASENGRGLVLSKTKTFESEDKRKIETYAPLDELDMNLLMQSFRGDRFSPMQIVGRISSNPVGFTVTKELKRTSKVCFICCNNYDGTKYALGDSALNDGIMAYIEFYKLGYFPFIFHDMKRNEFLDVFKTVISLNIMRVAVYYIGHGVTIADKNGDEDDGMDECLYFPDGTIVDDALCETVNQYKSATNRLILISDCCHSGTIYDITNRDDVVTMSAAADNETAKQDWIEHRGQGVFTYYLWKYYNKDISLRQLEKDMNKNLKRYKQSFVTNRIDKKLRDIL